MGAAPPAATIASGSPVATQPQLPFVRDIRAEYPKATPTADSLGEAEASDQQRYYLKGDLSGKPIRASEWISTQLAELIGIAAPAVAILRRANGETVFGSRRLIGVADEIVTRNFLLTASASNAQPVVVGLCPLLSAIYAFDLFVQRRQTFGKLPVPRRQRSPALLCVRLQPFAVLALAVGRFSGAVG